MAINYVPKVGAVLTCNFGDYARDAESNIVSEGYDGRLKPEMVKQRLVIVINSKIDTGACIVVPLSTTKDQPKLSKGLHVEIPMGLIPDYKFFRQRVSWAKADLVQQVSKQRLFKTRLHRGFADDHIVDNDMITAIQRAIIKSINAASMINP